MNDDDNERFRFLDRLSIANLDLTESEAKLVDRVLENEEIKAHERPWIDRMYQRFGPQLRDKL